MPTPKYNTFKRGFKKQKYNNSSNNKLSDINTNKPFKLENIYKALKLKPKPKVTLTATIVLSRITYTTITYIVLLKKRAKDAKTKAISPIAGVKVANIKLKTKRKARIEVNYNISKILPPKLSLDFT